MGGKFQTATVFDHAMQRKKNQSLSGKWMAPRDQAKKLLAVSRNVASLRATRISTKIPMGPHPQPQLVSGLLLQTFLLHLHTPPTNHGGSDPEPRPETTPYFSIFTRSLQTHFVSDRFLPVLELRPSWKPEMESGFRRERVWKWICSAETCWVCWEIGCRLCCCCHCFELCLLWFPCFCWISYCCFSSFAHSWGDISSRFFFDCCVNLLHM